MPAEHAVRVGSRGPDLAAAVIMELSTADVRGRSFAGANLSSATLSGFDLRGTDLSGADLRDADLSLIRSGMSRGWAVAVVAASLVVSLALGVIVGMCARDLRALYATGDVRLQMVALYVAGALLVFLIAGTWKGLRFAARNVLPVTAALAVAVGVIAIITGAGTGVGGLVALLFVVIAAALVALAVLVRAVAGGAGKLAFSVVAIAGGLAGGAAGGGLAAVAVAVAAMAMARRSEKLEASYPLLARATAAIAARHGTSFRNADLAGANLNGARLVACDFRGANLRDVHLDRANARLCRFDKETP